MNDQDHAASSTVLPEGEYDFTVEGFDKARSKKNNIAMLRLLIDAPEGMVVIQYSLVLNIEYQDALSEFFASIGLFYNDGRIKMDWSAVLGAAGRCMLGVRKKNGKESNYIDCFIGDSD